MIDAIVEEKEASVRYYKNWVDHIKKTVPPKKLLIVESKEGWDPLCNFLNLKAPEEPYPRVNDRGAKQNHFVKTKYLAIFVVFVIPIILSLISISKIW